jgi:hypothetical protein
MSTLRTRSNRRLCTLAVCALALSACGDLLTVSDPERYTSEDLDNALPAVANGVEGALHEVFDSYVYQHTGTWSGYDETDHGRFQYGTSAMDGTNNAWLRTRWFADDAEERFTRILEGAAASDPLMAQVHLSKGLAALYLGLAFCESPSVASGTAVTDMEMLDQAVTELTRAIQTAQAANTPDYETAALAGRARANLMLGNDAAAAADAAGIPAGFSYDAVFNLQSTNSVVQLTTKQNNEAAGLMYVWWDQIDESPTSGFMRDPWTDEPDPRIPVFFDGEVATDNETPHYSQWKYTIDTDDIPMLHSDAMELIQAEVLANSGDYTGAMGILNGLRDAVGLTPLPVPADAQEMQDYLLSERFAELFMEGMRMVDLHRFGLVDDIFVPLNDTERPGTGRPTKFSMSSSEATYNAQIVDDLNQRCLPKS